MLHVQRVTAVVMDVMAALRERRAKAESKVARAEKALETARKELADVVAAERVVADITGESSATAANEGSVSPRDVVIAKMLPAEPEHAIGPAELHSKYQGNTGDEISLEAFRTALWRMLKKVIRGDEMTWIVKAENGKYWREPIFPPDTFASDDDVDDIFG